MNLREEIENLASKTSFVENDRVVYEAFKSALRRGEIRSAEKDADGNWLPNVSHLGKMIRQANNRSLVGLVVAC